MQKWTMRGVRVNAVQESGRGRVCRCVPPLRGYGRWVLRGKVLWLMQKGYVMKMPPIWCYILQQMTLLSDTSASRENRPTKTLQASSPSRPPCFLRAAFLIRPPLSDI